ncbi:MAG TPA: MraY family glycosyltransferase [bacterium]|nr:MraY family glycosyltransferase [bacterium]
MLARRWGVLDHPAPRKLHARPTPLLGGVATYVAFAAATTLFLRPVIHDQMTLLLAGAAAFGFLGLLDDLWDAGAWKLVAEAVVVTAIVWLGGFQINLPWPGSGAILAILWILGVANAVNCLDCADGVAPGITLIGGLALTVLAVSLDRWGVAVAAAATAGASLGFLRYNFPPARIFLGDAGSLMLGFLLAALSAALVAPAVSTEWAAPLMILGIPVFDFLFVHVRRYQQGVRHPLKIVTSTGKDHLPHRLLQAGLSNREAAVRVYTLSAVAGITALALVLWGPIVAALLGAPLLITGLTYLPWVAAKLPRRLESLEHPDRP